MKVVLCGSEVCAGWLGTDFNVDLDALPNEKFMEAARIAKNNPKFFNDGVQVFDSLDDFQNAWNNNEIQFGYESYMRIIPEF